VDPLDAALAVLGEEGGGPLHWTVIQDLALRREYLDPFTQPDIRKHLIAALAAGVKDGVLVRDGTGLYRVAAPAPEIRAATEEDLLFLREMLYEAAGPEPGEPDPGIDGLLAQPIPASYLQGWGRAGDVGAIAEHRGEPVGAAWCRLPGKIHGWGYVADDIPEVVIAVMETWRGRGVGRGLLTALIRAATDAGRPALSLSVLPSDPAAVHLYRSAGFEKVATNEDLWVMRRELR
jgi:GNAT superfamily N-acetyltransferase